jgi:hypothetical protein
MEDGRDDMAWHLSAYHRRYTASVSIYERTPLAHPIAYTCYHSSGGAIDGVCCVTIPAKDI